jgi:hypothetical protein
LRLVQLQFVRGSHPLVLPEVQMLKFKKAIIYIMKREFCPKKKQED